MESRSGIPGEGEKECTMIHSETQAASDVWSPIPWKREIVNRNLEKKRKLYGWSEISLLSKALRGETTELCMGHSKWFGVERHQPDGHGVNW